MPEVHYRTPSVHDASAVHQLVAETHMLDDNSWYYYAIFFRDFETTSMVVDVDNELAGFVTGYIRPGAPDTLFLWQTATTLNHGVTNLGLKLLEQLINSVQMTTNLNYVEATIDPENRAIAMQFRLLARSLGVESEQSILFDAADFHQLEHDEKLIRLGPIV
ncbi:diaminobutyrate acetyltransferase [Nesterenkonia cremea]|uniref:L-2,4-diaminobutyric acid acetyltransferase n=1 Tax=Nesterenkonia cremea TaxID=1882340 RepID=A0A917AU01_9MICC|nr:diaminobutyrate acetyltransferase [Nesterenkonia cremea]GGE75806.1 L-2,4-diaminobutyric acid acetyltransferase [Nesterenkonia cremea]